MQYLCSAVNVNRLTKLYSFILMDQDLLTTENRPCPYGGQYSVLAVSATHLLMTSFHEAPTPQQACIANHLFKDG